MSTDDIDVAASDKHVQQPAKQKRRGWFRRNWKWFVPALLLTIIVVGGGVLYWALFTRVYNLDVCQSAMRTIAADKGLQKALGQPIEPVRRPPSLFSKAGWQKIMPSARVEEREIDVRWIIAGPRGNADAKLLAKRRSGEWQTVMLEVTPTGGKKVLLQEVGSPANEAPVFQGANPEPPKPQGKKPDAKAPDINIDLPIPPGDAPAGTK